MKPSDYVQIHKLWSYVSEDWEKVGESLSEEETSEVEEKMRSEGFLVVRGSEASSEGVSRGWREYITS